MGIEGCPNQEMRAVVPEGQAVGDAARDACSRGKISQQNGRADGKRTRTAEPAALAADHKRDTFLGEGMHAIEAGDADGDFHPQAGAASGRSGRENFHEGNAGEELLRFLTIVTDHRRAAANRRLRGGNESNLGEKLREIRSVL